jgi:hypothetical protein
MRLSSGRVSGPALPRPAPPDPASGWPADVHIPDEREDDEC